MKLVVIGGGNMGLTYAKGIHKAGLLTEKISILETGDVFTQLVQTEPDFNVYDNAEDCIKNADILLIAVKPFHAKDVFESIKNHTTKNQVVISVMAGVKISTIESGIGLEKIVRSMPNLPAMIGKGMTAFTSSKNLSIEEEKIVVQILESTGAVSYTHLRAHET